MQEGSFIKMCWLLQTSCYCADNVLEGIIFICVGVEHSYDTAFFFVIVSTGGKSDMANT